MKIHIQDDRGKVRSIEVSNTAHPNTILHAIKKKLGWLDYRSHVDRVDDTEWHLTVSGGHVNGKLTAIAKFDRKQNESTTTD